MVRSVSSFVGIILFVLSASSVAAQRRGVEVRRPGSLELQQTAHRLRMCEERLGQIRQVLEKTTELVPALTGGVHTGELGNHWQRFHPGRAEAVIRAVVDDLRVEAARTTDPQSWRQLLNNAVQLVHPLRDSETLVKEIFTRWPGAGTAEFEQVRERQMRSLRMNQWRQTTWQDPVGALENLSDAEGDKVDINGRADLVRALMTRGQKESAVALFYDTLERAAAEPSPNVYQLLNFARTAISAGPELVDEVIPLVKELLRTPEMQKIGKLTTNGLTLEMTQAEIQATHLLRSVQNQPRLALRVVEELNLQPVLEEVEGIDNFFSGRDIRPNDAARQIADPAPDPGRENDEYLQRLVQEASNQCNRGPEKTAALIKTISQRVRSVESVQKKTNYFQRLARVSIFCFAEISPEVEALGREVIEDLRQEEAAARWRSGIVSLGRRRSQPDYLENLLIASKVFLDFPGALLDAEGIRDPARRYQIFQQMIRYLSGQY